MELWGCRVEIHFSRDQSFPPLPLWLLLWVQICWGSQGQPYIRWPHCSQMDMRLFPHNTHQIFWCKRFEGGFSFPQASYKQSRRWQTVSNHCRSLERGRACASVRTDGASAIAGETSCERSPRARPPNVQWTRCMLRGEVPASKQLIPDLTDVTTHVIATVNCIKTQHVKAFWYPPPLLVPSAPCREMGPIHTAVLFHCKAWWLSRRNVLSSS